MDWFLDVFRIRLIKYLFIQTQTTMLHYPYYILNIVEFVQNLVKWSYIKKK